MDLSGSTVELNLKTAVDADDTADYLTLSLADSLRTVDALFNNVTGHTHSGAKQGGPLGAGSIPNGLITSAMIAEGTITSGDLAAGAVSVVSAVVGVTNNPTTTSVVLVDLPDMAISYTTQFSSILLQGWTSIYASGQDFVLQLAASLDGADTTAAQANTSPVPNAQVLSYTHAWMGLAAGPHTFKLRWSTSGGTATAIGIARLLTVVEFRR